MIMLTAMPLVLLVVVAVVVRCGRNDRRATLFPVAVSGMIFVAD